MSEPSATGAVVRPHPDSCLVVDGYIKVEQITRGPHKGRWSWQISTPPQITNRGYQALRNGIAESETQAAATAKRALNWHLRRVESVA